MPDHFHTRDRDFLINTFIVKILKGTDNGVVPYDMILPKKIVIMKTRKIGEVHHG
jgi:hypothetical protein